MFILFFILFYILLILFYIIIIFFTLLPACVLQLITQFTMYYVINQ